ncbi:hypothetical protein MXB_2899 [Myxobolus squamalis]|nr:hypothetical protein MXB_2899 [Myxobolus squamalis]
MLGKSYEYEVAFENEVPSDPTVDELYNLVVTQNYRPKIPSEWKNNHILKNLEKIMIDCWFNSPQSRPKMTNIRRRLRDINENSPN